MKLFCKNSDRCWYFKWFCFFSTFSKRKTFFPLCLSFSLSLSNQCVFLLCVTCHVLDCGKPKKKNTAKYPLSVFIYPLSNSHFSLSCSWICVCHSLLLNVFICVVCSFTFIINKNSNYKNNTLQIKHMLQHVKQQTE